MKTALQKEPISKFFKVISGQHVLASHVSDDDSLTPYLTGPADFPNGHIYVTKYVSRPKVMSRRGDILLTVKGSGVGKTIFADQDYCISRQLMALRGQNGDNLYLYHCLKLITEKLNRKASGTIPGITKDDISKWEIPWPSKDARKKIAEILSTWDEAIEKLQTQTERIKERKQGFLQKLIFTSGDKQGWLHSQLQEIATITMGQSPKSEFYNSSEKGMPLIQGKADILNRKANPKVFTTHITKKSQAGDILLTVRAPVGYVAKSSIDTCIGRGVCAIKPISINEELLYQILIGHENMWGRHEQGSTFTAINSNVLRSFQIRFPKSKDEQQKIANFLSLLDIELEIIVKQKTLCMQQKNGLMQQLLTGKRRVKV